MFFIIGITQGKKALGEGGMAVCPGCGAMTRLEFFMTYTALTLFFIPTLRWDKRYFARSRCCGAVYAVDAEVGRRIARGENPTLRAEDLTPVSPGRGALRRCPACGYATGEDFQYCPKCGGRLE